MNGRSNRCGVGFITVIRQCLLEFSRVSPVHSAIYVAYKLLPMYSIPDRTLLRFRDGSDVGSIVLEHNFSLSFWVEGLCWEGSRKLVEFTVDRRLVVDSNLSTHSGWQRFVVTHVISAPSTNRLSLPDALCLHSLSLSYLLSLWEPRASNTIKFSTLYEIVRPSLAGVMYPQLSVLVLAI